MNSRYPWVAARAGHRCEYRHAPEIAFNFSFEVEHIDPASAGGTFEDSNLALGCRSCNLYKSDHVVGRDPRDGSDVRLFNPRTDSREHFEIELDSVIVGRTAMGRATIHRLQMNSPRQVAARRQWRILQIFP